MGVSEKAKEQDALHLLGVFGEKYCLGFILYADKYKAISF